MDEPNDAAWLLSLSRREAFEAVHNERPSPRAGAIRALIEAEVEEPLRPWLRMFWQDHPAPAGSAWRWLRFAETERLSEQAGPALRSLREPILNHIQCAQADLDPKRRR